MTLLETIIDSKSTRLSFVFPGLIPGHTYCFMVGSLRNDGSGTLSGPSDPIEVLQNAMDRPLVEQDTDTTIAVRWDTPNEINGYEIMSYDVMAVDQHTQIDYVCNTKSANTRFIFKKLTPGHFYRFMGKPLYNRILVENNLLADTKSAPYSGPSEAIQVPPPAPVVDYDTSTTVDVSWLGLPDRGIETVSYDVKAIEWGTYNQSVYTV